MTDSQRAAIQFRNVSKRFMLQTHKPQTVLETMISIFQRRRSQSQELWAVRDLTLDVMPGQSLGIIGRNGAGKSTLLKLVSRILRPTAGEVLVNGRVSALLELGAGFHPDLTGRENIYLNGSVLGLSRQDIGRQFDAIVDFSELGDFIDVPVKHYSSGMYMRLGFSVAIHVEPDILLVDEILAVGDQAFQEKCLNRIFELQRQGMTIVIVSHHSQVIRSICSHALWIEHGVTQAVGHMPGVLAAYAAHYAQPNKKRGEGEGFRWGTGEVKMNAVRLCGLDGQEQDVFRPHDTFQIQIDYETERRVHQPYFEVTIFRDDGLQVTGGHAEPIASPNGLLEGRGTVTYHIDRLPLLPGEYRLTIAVHDGEPQRAYDCHELAYPFTVEGDRPDSPGLVHFGGQWTWLPHQETTLFNV